MKKTAKKVTKKKVPVKKVAPIAKKKKGKWSSTLPKSSGWYWCKYYGKKGVVICPGELTELEDGMALRTAKNDFFWFLTGQSTHRRGILIQHTKLAVPTP